jgi:truncated hemoglobin YjbI
MPSWIPTSVKWKSKEAEGILKNTQEIIYDGGISAHAGVFKGIRLLPRFLRVRKNPKGQTLANIIPVELHDRIAKLAARFGISENEFDNLSPTFAGQTLQQRVIAAASLTSFWSSPSWSTAHKDARRRKVRLTTVGADMGDPAELLKNLERGPSDAAIDCLAATVTELETIVDSVNARARSWAMGDIEQLRRFDYPDSQLACGAVLLVGSQRAQVLAAQVTDAWIAAADKALTNNRSTFAMLPINQLLTRNERLTALQTKGYIIEEPQFR